MTPQQKVFLVFAAIILVVIVLMVIAYHLTKSQIEARDLFFADAQKIEDEIRNGLPFNTVNLEIWALDGRTEGNVYRKMRVIELAKMAEVKYNEKIITK